MLDVSIVLRLDNSSAATDSYYTWQSAQTQTFLFMTEHELPREKKPSRYIARVLRKMGR